MLLCHTASNQNLGGRQIQYEGTAVIESSALAVYGYSKVSVTPLIMPHSDGNGEAHRQASIGT
jgi:hypothetical protein